MIETLNTITESVIKDLSGGPIPDDSPYDEAFVRLSVRDALREDLKLELLNRRAGSDGENDRSHITQYIASYFDVQVQYEASTKRAYIDLPSTFMSMSWNKGLHCLADMRTPLKQMIPVTNPGVTVHLQHGNFERDNYGFYAEGRKVYWMRNILQDKVTKVLLKLIVPAPDTWGNDDPLPVLGENIARVKRVVKNDILNRFPNDRVNDNNPNIRPQNV
jgi:hypothetical protein